MPSVSIDTFFACALTVSVALLATAFFAGTMQTRINSLEEINKQDYLNAIAEHIVTSYGDPVDWGSEGLVPSTFGLGDVDSPYMYSVDIDKIGRLSNQSSYVLSYPDVHRAARLNNLALGVSLSQMLTVNVELADTNASADAVTYTFKVSVTQDAGPASAGLSCYAVANGFLASASSGTAEDGVGYVDVQVPNSSNGTALLVVFARAAFDNRVTAYTVYPFEHLSQKPLPNNSFLDLSPLDYILHVGVNDSSVGVEAGYAFSYMHQSNLTATSNTTYTIPVRVDKSPMVLVFFGTHDAEYFAEWTSYPLLPRGFGADFAHAEENVFTYVVTIKEVLYRLTLCFGDVVN